MALSFSFGTPTKDTRSGYGSRERVQGRGRNRNKKRASSLPLILSMVGGLAVASGTMGYFVWQDMNALKPDEYACYPQVDQAQTVIFVDSSSPRMDAAQARDFNTFVSAQYFRRASANERIRFYNTEVDQIGSIPDPVVETCVPASTNAELEALGAPSANPAYLTTQRQRVFDDTIAPAVATMSDPAPDRPQRFESPILEQIQGLSRLPEFRAATGQNTLVIVSDLIQATHEIQACREPGHLPRFETFKAGEHWTRLQPESLAGVDVEVLMLIRPAYGPHCTGEDELLRWWEAYFEDTGAQSVSFTRLRFDVSGGR